MLLLITSVRIFLLNYLSSHPKKQYISFSLVHRENHTSHILLLCCVLTDMLTGDSGTWIEIQWFCCLSIGGVCDWITRICCCVSRETAGKTPEVTSQVNKNGGGGNNLTPLLPRKLP